MAPGLGGEGSFGQQRLPGPTRQDKREKQSRADGSEKSEVLCLEKACSSIRRYSPCPSTRIELRTDE